MEDLDPTTLEKFQRFQAMLAASPEIVEALNSPEILALAAKTAAEKKQQGHQNPQAASPPAPAPPSLPPPQSEPQPQYPMVGYGVSDDVSVLSEMTTPTVMTRQTVEEDEFYPEVDGSGLSSSGLGGKPRRIGLRIGVNSAESGHLPPPPPKPNAVAAVAAKNGLKIRHRGRKSRAMAHMSKIVENHDVASVDDKEENGSTESDSNDSKSRKGSWSPKERSEKIVESHPFFGNVGVGAVSRQARHQTYNKLTRRTKGRERGVNRNRSMPTNVPKMAGSISGSSNDSRGDEEDDPSKTSGEFFSNDSNSTSVDSDTRPVKVRSKASMSPASIVRMMANPLERGVLRNHSMPLKVGGSSTNISTEAAFKVVGGASVTSTSSKSLSQGDEESLPDTKEKSQDEDPPPMAKDGRNSFLNTGDKTPRTKNAPRMRLVPVVSKSFTSAESAPAKLMGEAGKPRSRSLSKNSNRNLRDKIRGSSSGGDNDNISRSSAPVKVAESLTYKSLTRSDQPKKPRGRSLSKYSNSSRSTSSDEGDDLQYSSASVSSKSFTRLDEARKPRSRSSSKYSNRKSLDSSIRSTSSDEGDEVLYSSAPTKCSESVSSKSLKRLDRSKKPRSRSSSKYSSTRSTSSDEGDIISRSSAPVNGLADGKSSAASTESGPAKILIDPKKPRSGSLTKYSKRNLKDNLRRGNNSSDNDDNISRASAPVTSSIDSGKRSFGKDKRSESLKKYSYRLNTESDDDDDSSQPSLPLRVPCGGDDETGGKMSYLSSADESDDIHSTGTESNTEETDSEDEKEEERPTVVRRWKPPAVDNSALPPAFRSLSSHSGKLCISNDSGKFNGSNHSGNYSTSNHSEKISDGFKVLKKGRKPVSRPRVMPSPVKTKTSSDEEKESRTEEQNSTSSSDNEGDYVRQTVRKRGKSKTRETEKSSCPNEKSEEFEHNLAELNEVLQAEVERPSEYLTGADSAFAATRKKKGQTKKKSPDKPAVNSIRETDWLGGGVAKKRTWRAKSVKQVL